MILKPNFVLKLARKIEKIAPKMGQNPKKWQKIVQHNFFKEYYYSPNMDISIWKPFFIHSFSIKNQPETLKCKEWLKNELLEKIISGHFCHFFGFWLILGVIFSIFRPNFKRKLGFKIIFWNFRHGFGGVCFLRFFHRLVYFDTKPIDTFFWDTL